jgi:hypothetical protein
MAKKTNEIYRLQKEEKIIFSKPFLCRINVHVEVMKNETLENDWEE